MLFPQTCIWAIEIMTIFVGLVQVTLHPHCGIESSLFRLFMTGVISVTFHSMPGFIYLHKFLCICNIYMYYTKIHVLREIIQ